MGTGMDALLRRYRYFRSGRRSSPRLAKRKSLRITVFPQIFRRFHESFGVISHVAESVVAVSVAIFRAPTPTQATC